MRINPSDWPLGHLRLAATALTAALLAACGGGNTEDPNNGQQSSSSVANNSSSVANTSSVGSSSSQPDLEPYDHCVTGFRPHVTNGRIETEGHLHQERAGGEVDISVDPVVLNYMYEHGWQDAHVLWHQARTCGGPFGGGGINGLPSACTFPELLPTQSDCEGDQNGLEFLAAHSLMMYQLRQLWPDHKEQFSGWESFPRTAQDYPAEIRGRFQPWSDSILMQADIGDNIEQHLDKFPNEGALGTWISCAILPGVDLGGGPTFPGAPTGGATFNPQVNMHFGLHDKAAPISNRKHSVNNTNVNVDSYMFWKLHSWIDHVWQRYRAAKGLTNNGENYDDIMQDQCREMDAWREIALEARGEDGHPNQSAEDYVEIPESGFFHERIRPAFEENCTKCHGRGGEAGLRLGDQITSSEVVESLINRDSHYTVGYRLIVPGSPNESWLYLKATGQSQQLNVQCQGIAGGCNGHMPGLDDQELNDLRQWILDGAPLPTLD